MAIILRFKGLSTLPIFGKSLEEKFSFFNAVENCVFESKVIVLNGDNTEDYDATKNDTLLVIDVTSKEYDILPLTLKDVGELISILKHDLNAVDLLKDNTDDKDAKAQRRTVMVTMS